MMRQGVSPWDDEKDRALLRLRDADLAFETIASRLNEMFGAGLTKNAVLSRFRRMGGVQPLEAIDHWRPEVVEALKAGHGEGLTYDGLADKLTAEFGWRYSRQRTVNQVKKLGLRDLKNSGGNHVLKPKRCAAVVVVAPRPVPVAHAPAPDCVPVTLADRRRDQCCWPVNDGNPYLFCGAPKRRPDPRSGAKFAGYCDHHFARLLSKPRRRMVALG
jgi:hypothetical protein